KHFKQVRSSIVVLQKHLRRHIHHGQFVKKRKAALVLQKYRRGQVARARNKTPVCPYLFFPLKDEARQMEEILQLEREIERLQKKREDEVSQLCESSKQELQLRRDAELKRMKKEASRKATELIDLLNFGGVDPSVEAVAAKPAAEVKKAKGASTAGGASKEEDVDEGFHAEEECIPLPDFPPPAESDAPIDQDIFVHLPPPPPAFAEGTVPPAPPPLPVDGIPAVGIPPPPPPGDGTLVPPPSPPSSPPGEGETKEETKPDSERKVSMVESLVDGEEPIYSMPADTESDYDQEDEEGSVTAGDDSSVSGSNRGSAAVTDEEHPRKSTCTNTSVESYRGSSDSVRTHTYSHPHIRARRHV
ncbi:hypothetical protein XENOCAPTIV_016865, partial [Xenoophorus captivus]